MTLKNRVLVYLVRNRFIGKIIRTIVWGGVMKRVKAQGLGTIQRLAYCKAHLFL